MSQTKRASKGKRPSKAVSVLGIAGTSLAASTSGSRADISVADIPSQNTVPFQVITLGEEEISDVSWRRSISSTRKTSEHRGQGYNLQLEGAAAADMVAAAAAGAEAVAVLDTAAAALDTAAAALDTAAAEAVSAEAAAAAGEAAAAAAGAGAVAACHGEVVPPGARLEQFSDYVDRRRSSMARA